MNKNNDAPIRFKLEIEATGTTHFIVERNGDFMLQLDSNSHPGSEIYLTSSRVNSIEIAKKLAVNYVIRENNIPKRN